MWTPKRDEKEARGRNKKDKERRMWGRDGRQGEEKQGDDCGIDRMTKTEEEGERRENGESREWKKFQYKIWFV